MGCPQPQGNKPQGNLSIAMYILHPSVPDVVFARGEHTACFRFRFRLCVFVALLRRPLVVSHHLSGLLLAFPLLAPSTFLLSLISGLGFFLLFDHCCFSPPGPKTS